MPTALRPDLPSEIDGVFARVLAKRPDERYGSCREFVDAARSALGSPAPGPQAGLSFSGTRTGSQPGASADGFSWSRLASQPHAGDPVAELRPVLGEFPRLRPGEYSYETACQAFALH